MTKLEKLYSELEGAEGVARENILQRIAELEDKVERRDQGSWSDNDKRSLRVFYEPREYESSDKPKVIRVVKR